MQLLTEIKKYQITIIDGHSDDWSKIKGLSPKNSLIIDNYVSQNSPLGLKEIKEINALLQLFVKKEQTSFSIEIISQNQNIEELLIVQISIKPENNKQSDKEQVWKLLKEEGFDVEYEGEFINLIENNFSRVEFVKDGIGLRDFLFLSQVGINGFMNSIFFVEDLAVAKSDEFPTKEQIYYEGMEAREMVVLTKLQKFFNETKRTLYLGVGFEENLEHDEYEEMQMMQEAASKNLTLEEVRREKRKFPSWYANVAKMPEEVTFIDKNAEKYLTEYLEKKDLTVLKKELKKMKKNSMIELIENI